MNIVITIVLLFVLAVITHHLVAWSGSVLYSVDNEETLYAVFTFHDDRNQPMTTNILMNVCIPNVFMLFIFMAATKLQLHNIEKYLIWYVVLFYIYRSFLICVILRRKEMYSYLYELCMAAAGILLAVFLNNFFLATETTIFITASELREELWFAILVILFQFVKQILDKKVVQNTVLSKGQLTRYIIHKFEKFYKKYNDLLQITHVNRYMCIFLYSIMIFEDYNRGPIVRTIERMKIRLGKRATVGIMQMQSDIPLTDRESIIRFYAWLERNVEDSELLNPYDEYYIKDLAWKHNHDDAYANSVLYIFNCLYQYIDEVPKYRMSFHLREEVESQSSIGANIVRSYTTYSCEDISTFLHCIGNDTYIRLPEGHFNLPDYAQLSPHPFAMPISDGWALIISDIANMYICGMDTVVKTAYANTNVLTFQNCEYIVLDHLKLGHICNPDECQGAVLMFENCKDIIIKHLELSGCGTYGIIFSEGNIHIENCKIHDCTYGGITLNKASCIIDDTEIFDCKNIMETIINVKESNVVINNTTIHDCSAPILIKKDEASSVICRGVTIKSCECGISFTNIEDNSGIVFI